MKEICILVADDRTMLRDAIHSILKKVGVANRLELAVFAMPDPGWESEDPGE